MQPVRTTLTEDRARRDQQARASGFKDAADLARAYWDDDGNERLIDL